MKHKKKRNFFLQNKIGECFDFIFTSTFFTAKNRRQLFVSRPMIPIGILFKTRHWKVPVEIHAAPIEAPFATCRSPPARPSFAPQPRSESRSERRPRRPRRARTKTASTSRAPGMGRGDDAWERRLAALAGTRISLDTAPMSSRPSLASIASTLALALSAGACSSQQSDGPTSVAAGAAGQTSAGGSAGTAGSGGAGASAGGKASAGSSGSGATGGRRRQGQRRLIGIERDGRRRRQGQRRLIGIQRDGGDRRQGQRRLIGIR